MSRLLGLLTVWVLLGPAAHAQKPPGLGYVYPPAVPIGAAAGVQLGGYDFTADLEWFVHDEQTRLHVLGPPGDYHLTPPPYWIGPRASTTARPIPREAPARIETDGDAPPGLVRWQVANANGSSATAVFYRSDGREIVEARSRDLPQPLPTLPAAVSGRLSRLTEVDRYTLTAERDGPVSVELMARRLGSDFHGVLQVRDEAGELLADFADTQGVDGGLTFAAQSGHTYTISLHDVDFRGHRAYVYRLAFTEGPRVVCTRPAAGPRGQTREVEFVGYGLMTGRPVWESVRQTVSFPANAEMAAYTHSLKTPFGPVGVTIPLSDLEEIASPPDAAESSLEPQVLTAPVAVTAVLPPDVEEHRYSWTAQPNEHWSLGLQSRAIGGKLDVALAVFDPDGKLLAENDDLPGTTDAGLEFQSAAGGTYTCAVRSLSSRSGALDELYRLQIERQSPSFSLDVPQQVNLPLGGNVEVTVKAIRLGGFDGEIVVTPHELPDGVTAAGEWTIPAGKNELKAALQSAADAAVVASVIRFEGTAQVGGQTVTRPATAAAAGNLCPRSPDEQRIPHVLLALTMPPPIEVLVVDRERQRDVHRGTTYLAELEIVRKDGFAGEIQVEMSAQQSRDRQGIRGPILPVPADAGRIFYPCFMPEWLGTDLTRRMVVHGVAAVPDPQGNLRYLTQPADARITMIMEGALLKLSSLAEEPAVRLGQPLEVPVLVSRSPKLPLPVTVELVPPEEAADWLKAEPLVLPAGADRGTLRIRSTSEAGLKGRWPLRLRATALQDGQWPVISETDLPVEYIDREE